MRRASFFVLGAVLAATVAGAPPQASADCTVDMGDPLADGATVTCSGTDSTGFDASAFDDLTITVEPLAQLDDSDPGIDGAVLVGERATITLGPNSTVDVTEAGGVGIGGGPDTDVEISGTFFVDAAGARGVSVGSGTEADRSGVVLESSGAISVAGDDSVGIEAGDDVSVDHRGRTVVAGDRAVGIDVGDRTNRTLDTGVRASAGGAGSGILVQGTDAIGIRVGDGWNVGEVDSTSDPLQTGVQVETPLDVGGAGAVGLFLGDAGNTAGDHDSVASFAGDWSVTGVDAIGVSLGGNALFDDPSVTPAALSSFVDAGSFGQSGLPFMLVHQGGTLEGGPDAGPLIDVRDFSTGENRIGIVAGTTLSAAPIITSSLGGGVAIRGSGGVELVANFGTIEGNVLLGDGDDIFAQAPAASFRGILDGGAGQDQLVLGAATSSVASFDLSLLTNVETVRVGGGVGWTLTNGAGFTGLTRVADGGRLRAPSPVTLGGDLEVAADAFVQVAVDGVTVPLTVAGSASLDGTLVVDPDSALAPSATPYLVVATTARGGTEFDSLDVPTASSTQTYSLVYDGAGVSLLYQVVPISEVARGRNNQAVLDHLLGIQAAPGGDADVRDYANVLGDLGSAEVNAGFAALSSEAYDAQTSVVVDGGRRVADLLLERPRECDPEALDPWTAARAPLPCHARSGSPWVSAIGGFRSREGFAGHPRYDASLGGLAFGIDARPIDGLDLTLAIASQRGSVDVAGAGDSTLTLTDVAGHAAWSLGPVRAQTVVSWGHGFHDDRRRIRFVADTAGTVRDVRATADHDSDRITFAGEVGAAFDAGPIVVEPIAGVDWTWLWQRGFEEGGAGGFGLEVDDRSDAVGSVDAGVRLATVYHHDRYLARQLEWMDGVWRPRLDVRWRQMLTGTEREVDARLVGAPASVPGFTIEGKEDDGGLEVAAALSFVPEAANRLQFDLGYEAFVASHTLEQSLTGRVLLAF